MAGWLAWPRFKNGLTGLDRGFERNGFVLAKNLFRQGILAFWLEWSCSGMVGVVEPFLSFRALILIFFTLINLN